MASNYSATIDALGRLRAQIAELEIQETALRKELLGMGAGTYDGDQYQAIISMPERERLDMKAVREKLSPQFIRAHTVCTVVPTVSIRPRREKLAA